MHEFALAEAVVRAAEEAVGAESGPIRVVVKVGELQQIQSELFEYSLTQVIPAGDECLAKIQFVVEVEPVGFECRGCSRSFDRLDAQAVDGFDVDEAIHFIPELAHAFIRCPGCGSADFEITGGRGVSIEIETVADD